MTEINAPGEATDTQKLEDRVRELEYERRHLLALVEILQGIGGTLHYADILQTVTQKLGDAFGLDRCSIFLTEPGGNTARLVASYENSSIRNYVVDLARYPELKRALQSGETVFIPDADSDPNLKHIKGALASRNVKTITVVPITWRGVAIGAIFLRTFRDGAPFSESDIRFCEVVGAITAKALRSAHRYERLQRRQNEASDRARHAERERIALVTFLRRLLVAFGNRDGAFGESVLSKTSGEELDRLVEISLAVVAEEGKVT